MKTNSHEIFNHNPFAETEHSTHKINHAYMEVAHEAKAELPSVSFEGEEVRTNLPSELLDKIFEPEDHKDMQHPFFRTLLPSAVDGIPVGEYSVQNPMDDNPYFSKEIVVTDEGDGKRINFIRSGLYNNEGKSRELMTALGFQFKYDGTPEFVPTPQTLKSKAAELGVDIRLFPDQGHIDGKSYVGTFAEGLYPVATGSSEFWAHDIADDHMSTMVLGGEPLKKALQKSAQKALMSETGVNDCARDIDRLTAYLRGTISPTYNTMPRPYSEDTVQSIGQNLGLEHDEVSEIIATARANAEKFHMELNPAR